MKIGVDIGRSGIKVDSGKTHLLALPVVAPTPNDKDWQSRGALQHLEGRNGFLHLESWRLTYGGREWLVGERVEALGLPGQYAMTVGKATETTRLLILAALTALELPDPLELCVGLPHHRFEEEGRAMGSLLRGEHVVTVRDKERTLKLAGTVVPEGLGLWVRSVTPEEEGDLDRSLVRRPTVVLDFGHRTIQAAVFTGLRIRPQFYVSAHGAYEIWEQALIEALEGADGTVYESPQRAALMSRLLRDGTIQIRGREIRVETLYPRLMVHAARLWPRVREELRRMVEQVPYERVVVGGGGISLFRDFVRSLFGTQVVILDDRFAQAEGYRLYLEHRHALEAL